MKTVRVHVCTEHLIGTLNNLNQTSNRGTMRKDTFRER